MIPIIIHVISIFVQLLSDENVISFYKSSQNYNHPKCSGKFPPSKLKDKHAIEMDGGMSIASSTTFIIILFLFCCYYEQF